MLEFIIKALGSWTTKLHEILRNNHLKSQSIDMPIYVKGPYYTPAYLAIREERPLLIAGGIGLTPMLSVIHDCVYGHLTFMKETKRYGQLFPEDDEHAFTKQEVSSDDLKSTFHYSLG